MIISMKDVWHAAKKKHRAYVLEKIAIAEQLVGKSALTSQTLKDLLKQHAKDLATGSPATLRGLIDKVEAAALSGDGLKTFHKEASRVFNYDAFTNKDAIGWNAYDLCKLANQTLCPYCHQSFAFTIQRGHRGRGFRPTIDHFYPKAEYPYLSLSLFNLVPSCYTCNASLKGSINFHTNPHLHPFEDEEVIDFVFDLDAYLAWRSAPTAGLEIKVRHIGGASTASKADNSIRTFMLDERYVPHMGHFSRFAECVYHWSPDLLAIWKERLKIDVSEAVLLNFDREGYRDEMLGAVKRAIYDSLRNGSA
jgi:hypothetical protein